MKKCLIAAAAMGMSILMSMSVYAGTWREDQTGYWYAESDGTYTVSAWQEIDGKWYHFDERGYMQEGWIQDNGIWYYLTPGHGAMVADTTMTIDGVSYQFDGSGAMLDNTQTSGNGWQGSTFTSDLMNYQITVPARYVNVDTALFSEYIDYQQVVYELGVGRPDNEVLIVSVYYPGYSAVSANDMATVMASILTEAGRSYTLRERTTANLGGSTYEVVKLNFSESDLYQDIYIKKEGDNLLMLQTVYTPEHENEVAGIIGTIRNIR